MKHFLSTQIILAILACLVMTGCQTTSKVSGDVSVDYRTSNKF